MPPRPRTEPLPPKFLPNTQLRKLREERRLSQQDLADLVGCGQSDIAKIEGGQKKSTVDMMVRIARHLRVDPKDLMPPAPGGAPLFILPGREAAIGPRRPMHPRDNQDLIPVRSAARGGDQEMFLHDGPIDWRPRPFSLLNVADPYAIYVVGESMMPRFRPGQLLYVDPRRPAPAGYGVVVTKTNDAVTIKEYVRQSNSVLELRQYNPEAAIEIPLEQVRNMHMVVGIDEP